MVPNLNCFLLLVCFVVPLNPDRTHKEVDQILVSDRTPGLPCLKKKKGRNWLLLSGKILKYRNIVDLISLVIIPGYNL